MHITDEFHVHFQCVNGDGGEHVQRRVAGTEVIHFDQESVAPEIFNHIHQLVRVIGVGGFSDLQHELVKLQIILLKQCSELLPQLRIINVHAGYIYGNGDGNTEGFLPFSHLACGLIPHIPVQLLDQTVALKEGDEISRTDHAQLRMLPADQGFGAPEYGMVPLDGIFRLIEDNQISGGDGIVYVIDQLLLIF